MTTSMKAIALVAGFVALAWHQASAAEPVTVDSFARAESGLYIGRLAKDAGGLGKLLHHREPAPIDAQTVIRLNRDTLYSSAVFGLDAGPAVLMLIDKMEGRTPPQNVLDLGFKLVARQSSEGPCFIKNG